jgi:hypothetical protein
MHERERDIGIELRHMSCKGQMEGDAVDGLTVAEDFYALAA